MKKPHILHPFLFGIYPVLALYAYNIGQVYFKEALLWMAAILCLVSILLFLCGSFLRNYKKAAMIVSAFLTLFFLYGYIYDLACETTVYIIIRHSLLLPIWAAIFALIVYLIVRTRATLDNMTRILNFIGASLVLISLANIAGYELHAAYDAGFNRSAVFTQSAEMAALRKPAAPPDIYYIIMDKYASESSLKNFYGFDNSQFIDYLSDKGFYVASDTYANYSCTVHSLSSSLNMEYIDGFLTPAMRESSVHYRLMYPMFQDYRVWHILRSMGYKFIHFGSMWEPTSKNKYADMNVNLATLSDFSMMLYRSTAIFPIFIKLGIYDPDREEWKRIRYQFDQLGNMPEIKGPIFVFAHLYVPHVPYVFDRDGSFVSEKVRGKRTEIENYINQLIYTNTMAEEMVAKILSRSRRPPIIILQGDEGPFPPRFDIEHYSFDWRTATPEELRHKSGVLNAYYLPGVADNHLYKSITPVNSFRTIFNLYFGGHFPLLPDKNYVYQDEEHVYTLIDVTDKIKHK